LNLHINTLTPVTSSPMYFHYFTMRTAIFCRFLCQEYCKNKTF